MVNLFALPGTCHSVTLLESALTETGHLTRLESALTKNGEGVRRKPEGFTNLETPRKKDLTGDRQLRGRATAEVNDKLNPTSLSSLTEHGTDHRKLDSTIRPIASRPAQAQDYGP